MIWTLEIFDPTIRTTWNKQPKYLKDELTNHLVSLFRKDTFDTSKVLQKAGKHLKIVRDQYRVHLEKNPSYERPPMIPSRPGGRWKREGFEKIRKDTTRWNRDVCNSFQNVVVSLIITSFYINFGTQTNVFKNLIRILDTSKATKERIEKIGQHKLGPGGYLKLAARYVSIAKPESTSKYHTDNYFRFVLEKNVKLMTSCKYEV